MFSSIWTSNDGSITGGVGAGGGSGRSKSLSSPGPSGSNMGFSKVTSSIAALAVDANLKIVAWLQIPMVSSEFGRKLNPYRCLREPLGVKGVRQSVVITNKPSTIDQNQQLLVRFPNLGAHDVIVPAAARLAFRMTLNSKDANRTVVQNLGRAIVEKTVIKISGNEVMSVDDSDVFNCYGDLWKTALERKNDQYQGIDTSGNRNATWIRIDAGNKDETVAADKAIADAFGNRFYIPLDFELLEGHMPFYQSALGDRLEYELTFNDYSRAFRATGDADASYDIEI